MSRKWKKNELEMAIIAAQKALQKLVDENPRSGVIIDRGSHAESRIRASDAIIALDRVMTFFGDKGARSWGVCGSCDHFNQSGVSSVANSFGNCTNYLSGKKLVHCYDTCKSHSKEGGGYAI